MELNLVAILVATVAVFAVGAVWYTLFGKVWGEIHGYNLLTKEQQKAAQARMVLPYLAQLLITFVMVYVLAYFASVLGNFSVYEIAIWVWVGFIIPTQVSDTLFGGIDGKYVGKKIIIEAFGSLLPLLAGAWVLTLF